MAMPIYSTRHSTGCMCILDHDSSLVRQDMCGVPRGRLMERSSIQRPLGCMGRTCLTRLWYTVAFTVRCLQFLDWTPRTSDGRAKLTRLSFASFTKSVASAPRERSARSFTALRRYDEDRSMRCHRLRCHQGHRRSRRTPRSLRFRANLFASSSRGSRCRISMKSTRRISSLLRGE